MRVCENLCKHFGNRVLFTHFSWEISQGITAILGPSGCGKTTLLRLFSGLESPTEGKVHSITPVGMVFPDLRLVEWLSARDNIRLVCSSVPPQHILSTLHTLEIDSPLTPVAKLSSGQKQRVALARAWLFESPWLLLDEAFRSWDIGLKQRLFPILREAWHREKEYTILVTHDIMEALMIADSVTLLSFPPVHILGEYSLSLSEKERQNLSSDHPSFQHIRTLIAHYFDPTSLITQSQR
ncbi:MAG: ATP-binding cassette domain-containing protein [Brevinematales bacterium]|nr:ATP-binding cassette domain-containing protein [Brevinematales bacterium]